MMKKMMALMMALMLLTTPILSLAQETAAIDNALAAGKTLKTSISMAVNPDLFGEELAEEIAAYTINALFATDPAAQITINVTEGDELLGDMILEIGAEDEMYIQSSMLDEQAIRFDSEDTQLIFEKTLGYMEDEGILTAEEVSEIRAQMAEMSLTASAPAEAAETAEAVEFEIPLQELLAIDSDLLFDALLTVLLKMDIQENVETPVKAAAYFYVTLTNEDLTLMMDGLVKALASNPIAAIMMGEYMPTTEQIAEMLAPVKGMDIAFALDQEGTPVYANIAATAAADGEEATLYMTYTAATEGETTTHTAELGVMQGAEKLIAFPAKLIESPNETTMSIDIMGFVAELKATETSEQMEAGTYNEINLILSLTTPGGETLSGKTVLNWNVPLETNEDPIQAYTIGFLLNDDIPVATMTTILSTEEPTGTALADTDYADPAKMTDEEFAAFMDGLLLPEPMTEEESIEMLAEDIATIIEELVELVDMIEEL